MGEAMADELGEAKGPLTVQRVKAAKPGKHHDGGGTGLFLRVDPNGGRFWIQRLTIHGKRREIGLGSFPIVTLAQARNVALDNKRLAVAGGDPLAERRKSRDVITFSDAVDRYLAAKLDGFNNEKHRKQWRSTLDTYAKPKLGIATVQSIGVADVLRVLQPIWSETRRKRRRGCAGGLKPS